MLTGPKKARELLKKAADLGSPKGLEFYGALMMADPRFPGYAISKDKMILKAARVYLYKSLELGNGDAGVHLADTFRREGDIENLVKSLRDGAKLGSAECLLELNMIFLQGYFGQLKDRDYSECFDRVRDTIDLFEQPTPIPDFDQLCPPKQLSPFKEW